MPRARGRKKARSKRSKSRKKADYWIQEAIKRPGALRAYVKRVFGNKGFTSDGKIKVAVLHQLAKSPNITIRRRAMLALTLRRLKK